MAGRSYGKGLDDPKWSSVSPLSKRPNIPTNLMPFRFSLEPPTMENTQFSNFSALVKKEVMEFGTSDELEALRRDNFNLKVRIYTIEKNLSKYFKDCKNTEFEIRHDLQVGDTLESFNKLVEIEQKYQETKRNLNDFVKKLKGVLVQFYPEKDLEDSVLSQPEISPDELINSVQQALASRLSPEQGDTFKDKVIEDLRADLGDLRENFKQERLKMKLVIQFLANQLRGQSKSCHKDSLLDPNALMDMTEAQLDRTFETLREENEVEDITSAERQQLCDEIEVLRTENFTKQNIITNLEAQFKTTNGLYSKLLEQMEEKDIKIATLKRSLTDLNSLRLKADDAEEGKDEVSSTQQETRKAIPDMASDNLALQEKVYDLEKQLLITNQQKGTIFEQYNILKDNLERLTHFMRRMIDDRMRPSDVSSVTSEFLSEASNCLDQTIQVSQTLQQSVSNLDSFDSTDFADESFAPESTRLSKTIAEPFYLHEPGTNEEVSALTPSDSKIIDDCFSNMDINQTRRRRRWSSSSPRKPRLLSFPDNYSNDSENLKKLQLVPLSDSSEISLIKMVEGNTRTVNAESVLGSNCLVPIVKPRNSKTHANLSSDSDIWSEPDREVSVQRVGIQMMSPMKSPAQKRNCRKKAYEEQSISSDNGQAASRTRRKRSCASTSQEVSCRPSERDNRQVLDSETSRKSIFNLQAELEKANFMIRACKRQISQYKFSYETADALQRRLAQELLKTKEKLLKMDQKCKNYEIDIAKLRDTKKASLSETSLLSKQVPVSQKTDEETAIDLAGRKKSLQLVSSYTQVCDELPSGTEKALCTINDHLYTIQKLKQDYEESESLINQLKEENDQLQERARKLREELSIKFGNQNLSQLSQTDEAKLDDTSIVNAYDNLVSELKLTQTSLRESEAANEALAAKISKLEDTVLRKEEVIKVVLDLLKKVEEKVAPEKEAAKTVEEYENQIDELKNVVADLKKELKSTKWRKDFYLVTKTVINQRLTKEIADKENEIKEREKEVEVLKNKLAVAEEQLALKEQKEKDDGVDKVSLKTSIRQLELQSQGKDAELKALKEKHDTMKHQNTLLEKDTNELKEEVLKYKNQISELTESKALLEEEKTQLQNEISKVIPVLDSSSQTLSISSQHAQSQTSKSLLPVQKQAECQTKISIAFQRQAQSQTSESLLPVQKQAQSQTSKSLLPVQKQAESQTSKTSFALQRQSQSQTSNSLLPVQKQSQSQTSKSLLPVQKQSESQTSKSLLPVQKQSESQTSKTSFALQRQSQSQTSKSLLPVQKQGESQTSKTTLVPQKQVQCQAFEWEFLNNCMDGANDAMNEILVQLELTDVMSRLQNQISELNDKLKKSQVKNKELKEQLKKMNKVVADASTEAVQESVAAFTQTQCEFKAAFVQTIQESGTVSTQTIRNTRVAFAQTAHLDVFDEKFETSNVIEDMLQKLEIADNIAKLRQNISELKSKLQAAQSLTKQSEAEKIALQNQLADSSTKLQTFEQRRLQMQSADAQTTGLEVLDQVAQTENGEDITSEASSVIEKMLHKIEFAEEVAKRHDLVNALRAKLRSIQVQNKDLEEQRSSLLQQISPKKNIRESVAQTMEVEDLGENAETANITKEVLQKLELEADIAELQEKINVLKDKLKEAESRNEELLQNNIFLRYQLGGERESQAIQHIRSSMERESSSQAIQHIRSSMDTEDALSTMRDILGKLEVKEIIDQLLKDRSDLNKAIRLLKAKNKSLEDRVQSFWSFTSDSSRRASQWEAKDLMDREKLTELMSILESKDTCIKDMLIEKRNLEAYIDDLERQLGALQRDSVQARSELTNVQNKFEEQSMKCEKMRTDLRHQSDASDDYKRQLEDNRRSVSSLEQQLSTTNSEASQNIQMLYGRIKNLQEELSDKSALIDMIRGELEKKSAYMLKVNEEMDYKTREIKRLSGTIYDKDKQIAQLENETTQMKQSLQAKDDDIQNLQDETKYWKDVDSKSTSEVVLQLKDDIGDKSNTIQSLNQKVASQSEYIKGITKEMGELNNRYEEVCDILKANKIEMNKKDRIISDSKEMVSKLEKGQLGNLKPLPKRLTPEDALMEDPVDMINNLINRKWSTQKSLLSLQMKLFDHIQLPSEEKMKLVSHLADVHAKMLPMGLRKVQSDPTLSTKLSGKEPKFTAEDVQQCYLDSLNSDMELLTNLKNLMKSFVLPWIKKAHKSTEVARRPPDLPSDGLQYSSREELCDKTKSDRREEYQHRSTYSSPDLGIESDLQNQAAQTEHPKALDPLSGDIRSILGEPQQKIWWENCPLLSTKDKKRIALMFQENLRLRQIILELLAQQRENKHALMECQRKAQEQRKLIFKKLSKTDKVLKMTRENMEEILNINS